MTELGRSGRMVSYLDPICPRPVDRKTIYRQVGDPEWAADFKPLISTVIDHVFPNHNMGVNILFNGTDPDSPERLLPVVFVPPGAVQRIPLHDDTPRKRVHRKVGADVDATSKSHRVRQHIIRDDAVYPPVYSDVVCEPRELHRVEAERVVLAWQLRLV